jgi:quercetin dioxygenase-like cupin family protein
MRKGRNLSDAELLAAGVGVAHHFGGKAYVKETYIKRGARIPQHAHDFDHLAYLVGGTVVVTVDGVDQERTGPHGFLIPAGKEHHVHAKTNAIWLCIWGTDCTDAALVDAAVERGE